MGRGQRTARRHRSGRGPLGGVRVGAAAPQTARGIRVLGGGEKGGDARGEAPPTTTAGPCSGKCYVLSTTLLPAGPTQALFEVGRSQFPFVVYVTLANSMHASRFRAGLSLRYTSRELLQYLESSLGFARRRPFALNIPGSHTSGGSARQSPWGSIYQASGVLDVKELSGAP